MKQLLGYLIIIFGIILGLYVGIWSMFIQPIMYACSAFDSNTLTGVIIGSTVIKCMFAGVVGVIIIRIGDTIGNLLIGSKKKRRCR